MQRRETTHAERVEMVKRHQAGESLSHIAHQLGLNGYTVRGWWRAYRAGGWAALEPRAKGPPTVGPLGQFHPLVKYVALRLKREYPGWGPTVLRLHLKRRASLGGLALPKNTARWSYLHQFGARLLQPRHLPTHRPATAPLHATAPHQCWQMDFKGDESLVAHAPPVIAWGLTDEASGAPLARCLHPTQALGNHAGITLRTVQADLRAAFARWGLPDAVRMDRAPLFVGSTRLEWPGTLLLWLVSLGIQPVINRAFRPTDNTLIERANRTWRGDVTRRTPYVNEAMLSQVSEQALADRRGALPSRHRGCHNQPPEVAFPELLQMRRPYVLDHERRLFDLRRVDQYLAQWEWQRRVDGESRISFAGHNLRVDPARHGQVLIVRFDPATREFVIAPPGGGETRRYVIQEVSVDYILGEGV